MKPSSSSYTHLLSREHVWDSIDKKNVEQFSEYLADNVIFRFGNSPTLVGKIAVKNAISIFFSELASLQHLMQDVWSVEDTTLLRLETQYTLLDDSVIKAPCFVTVHFDRPRLIDDYRIYIDLSPLHNRAHAPSPSANHVGDLAG